MASSAFGVTITGTSYKPTGRSKIPQGVESAVHYWNRFKQFPGVTMATGQMIDALKDLFDLARAVPGEYEARMNAIYQRFFMQTAPYEQTRSNHLSTLTLHMEKWRNLKVRISKNEEEAKRQTTIVQQMSGKIATLTQKLNSQKKREAEAAQQELDTLNRQKADLAGQIQSEINEIQGVLRILAQPLDDRDYSPMAGQHQGQDAFFPWFICRRPWLRKKPCTFRQKLTELNQKWADDMKEIDTKWEGFKNAAVPPETQRFKAFRDQVLQIGDKYNHGANHLNVVNRVRVAIEGAHGNEWKTTNGDPIRPDAEIWQRLRKVVETDLKRNPQWEAYNEGLGFAIVPPRAAHTQSQNIMDMDDLQHLLRPKRSYYQPHNHIAHEYSGYADDYSRAAVPYGGYIQSESEVYVLGMVMLFVFGLIVCFIWWVLCAAVAYHLVSKETKKKKDIESQLEYVSN
eukprot:445348_1